MARKIKEPVRGTAAGSNHPNPLISNDKLMKLYGTMLRCRLLQDRLRTLERQKKLDGNCHLSGNQEATAAATMIDLRPDDTVVLPHFDGVLGYARGIPLSALFTMLYGRSTDPDKGCSVSACGCGPGLTIVVPTPPIADYVGVGTGVALANHMKKNDNIVVAFSGPGATSVGFWHQALDFSASRTLPIVFVCWSNVSADLFSLQSQTGQDDSRSTGNGHSVPRITVDGSDVVAMYRVAQEAIERARTGGGPTLIEARTDDCEVGSAECQDSQDANEPKPKDSIAAMEQYLTGKALFPADEMRELSENFQKQLDSAIAVAESAPLPEHIDRREHLYSFDIRSRDLDLKHHCPQL